MASKTIWPRFIGLQYRLVCVSLYLDCHTNTPFDFKAWYIMTLYIPYARVSSPNYGIRTEPHRTAPSLQQIKIGRRMGVRNGNKFSF